MSAQREASRWYAEHRRALADAGVSLRARIEPAGGIYCTYSDGVIRMAIPDLDDPQGALQAHLIAAWMGIDAAAVSGLFAAMLPRLVAHEIGHALRDEAGRVGDDKLVEEHAAEQFASALSRGLLGPERRRSALAVLRDVSERLGGLDEAASTHHDPSRARRILGQPAAPCEPARAEFRARFAADPLYTLRTSIGWARVELESLEDEEFEEEPLDVCIDRWLE